MVSARRVLLVGSESGFTQTVFAQLRKLLDESPLMCRFDALRQHVGLKTDGLILVAAGSSAEGPNVRALLQELQLWNYPPRVVLLESAAAHLGSVLGPFEVRLTDRRTWRDNPRDLLAILREFAGHGLAFHQPNIATLREKLEWKLQQATPSLAAMIESLTLAAPLDIPILLTGESGTGKSYLSRLIHEHSPRSAHRLVSISCRSVPNNLIAGELFGYGKGALVGTEVARSGKLVLADHGTLVLDEINHLSIEHQTTLLRVLETGEFEPVGGDDTVICGARIVATSTEPIEDVVQRGEFRDDLYYRLNVMGFRLPPLRERPQDMEPLVRLLAARFAVKFGKEILRIHPDTFESLREYDWPGNLRQLEHVVQQAVLLCQGPELMVKNPAPLAHHRCPTVLSVRAGCGALEQSRITAERASIVQALEANQYCRSRTAAALGISRVTLYKKMREYGLLVRPIRQRSKSAAGA
jgi:DNA-binding NtrC family response regulator